jgi:hypothetical protein
MPKATAVWLVDNTGLTFRQIADFCGMHELEIQAIADGDVQISIVGQDPIVNGQLTREEIARCEADPAERLKSRHTDIPAPQARSKGARYTPVSKRQDRPDAIAWILKHHPNLADSQIISLLGTTKTTIAAIRDKTHWNTAAIKPRNPVTLGLCTEADLEKAVIVAKMRNPNPQPVVDEDEPQTNFSNED